jgi:hypothetical protein
MSERVVPGPVQDNCAIREAVCIHTRKIFDSCRDKDCIEDLRVYPTRTSQSVIDRALSVRGGRAELLQAYIDVEPAAYNKGFFHVDIRCYYRITAEAFVGGARPAEISGLAVFEKRVQLFGGERGAKAFSSRDLPEACCCGRSSLPEAILEVVDPIVLSLKVLEACEPCLCPPPCPPNPCNPCNPYCPPPPPPCGCLPENEVIEIPPCISACFDCDLTFESNCRRLYVTLGQFSIVRLERDTHLLIPMYDYCVPEKDCSCGAPGCGPRPEDPCELFERVPFPMGQFFPHGGHDGKEKGCGC